MRNKAKERYEDAHAQGYTAGYNAAVKDRPANKTKDELYYLLLTMPESFIFCGKTYWKEEEEVVTDPWAGCACGSSSTCGTAFTVDKSGVIDRPNFSEGRYTVLIKKETNTL